MKSSFPFVLVALSCIATGFGHGGLGVILAVVALLVLGTSS